MTGGSLANRNRDADTAVSIFHIAQNQWDQQAPPLNYGRYSHSSICAGQYVFVLGGYNTYSIETLHASTGEKWVLIEEYNKLLHRTGPVVAVTG